MSDLKGRTTARRCAVAAAGERHTLEAVLQAYKDGLIEPVLIATLNKGIQAIV